MLQFLINLLTPLFEDMGVSPTDVATYVNNLGEYIYAILGTFVLAVVIIVAAQFVVKKGRRHLHRLVPARALCGPLHHRIDGQRQGVFRYRRHRAGPFRR